MSVLFELDPWKWKGHHQIDSRARDFDDGMDAIVQFE